jgi:hypothetical protein
MRASIVLVICGLSGVLAASALVAQKREPFLPMAVTYPSELTSDRERADADFDAIQTLGFNAVRVTIDWANAEPARGAYELDALDAALTLSVKWTLGAVVRIDTASVPAWVASRYADGRVVPERGAASAPSRVMCLDHPGVRADIAAFVAAAGARASRSTASQAIEFADVSDGFCQCRYTQERYRAWLKSGRGQERAASLDRAAFVAFQNREHLEFLLNAARSTLWSIGTVRTPSLDLYSVIVPPPSSGVGRLPPARVAFALDAVRGAAGGKGWLMIDRASAVRLEEAMGAAELRRWAWAALSRGARGILYGDWRSRRAGDQGALVEADGTITARARAAGALARIIGRNQALFASLRPRPASAAIVVDPQRDASGDVAPSKDLSSVYAALIRRNIAVDVLDAGELASDAPSHHKLIFAGPTVTLPPEAALTLKRLAAAGALVVNDAATLPEERVLAAASQAAIAPEVRIEGGTGGVETRFLESSEVAMIVAINHADTPQRVTMAFAPDVQEAIWQNMESGAAVNFIAGPDGPRYTYSFGPRDALVLMIRKTIR